MGGPVDLARTSFEGAQPGHAEDARAAARFRPDLEGLRAVAVLLVLAYHAGVVGLAGGYIGVDVFFVLSGFLITGLIHRELSTTGRLSLTNFYARRARRLLPAAGFVLLVTLVASVFVLPAFRLPVVAGDVASAGVYLSNMRFGFQANDYFEAASAPSPVLHFWSLSVEEQFYIVWPTILVGLFAAGRSGRATRRVLLGIAAIGLASLAASIWLTEVNQPWAFYLLPTRAWELAIGGLIAVGATRFLGLPRRLASAAVIIGIVCIVAAAVTLTEESPFPGTAAILPVAGAALVILGGIPLEAPLPSRLLSIGPLGFLGRISYSLYLWHWPILLFGGILLGATFAIPLAILAIPVAAASYRWLEQPLRHGRFIGTVSRRNLAQAAGVGLAIVIASAAVWSLPGASVSSASDEAGVPGDNGGLPEPSDEVLQPGASPGETPETTAPQDPIPCADCSLADLVPTLAEPLVGRIPDARCDVSDPEDCVFEAPDPEAPVIALFGDSHAGNWTALLAGLARDNGWRFVHLTHGGCPSILTPVWSLTLKRLFTECTDWREAAIQRLEQEQPDLIVVTNSDHPALADDDGSRVTYANPPTEAWRRLWSRGFEALLARLTGIGSRVAVIGDPPVPSWSDVDPAECLASNADAVEACEAERSESAPPEVHDMARELATARGVTFVDPTPWFCDETACPIVIGRTIVYADGSGHLTTAFVNSLKGRLQEAIPFPG